MTELGIGLIACAISLATGSYFGRREMLKDLDMTWEEYFYARRWRNDE